MNVELPDPPLVRNPARADVRRRWIGQRVRYQLRHLQPLRTNHPDRERILKDQDPASTRDWCNTGCRTIWMVSNPLAKWRGEPGQQNRCGALPMNAFTIIELQQGTDQWREWRHNGIGSSDASIIMGENRLKSPSELLREKRGSARDSGQNQAMTRGIRDEPEARRRYTARTGRDVGPACLQSHSIRLAAREPRWVYCQLRCGRRNKMRRFQLSSSLPIWLRSRLAPRSVAAHFGSYWVRFCRFLVLPPWSPRIIVPCRARSCLYRTIAEQRAGILEPCPTKRLIRYLFK